MGASFDSKITSGETVRQAFRNAVESRQWSDGHGGYSGTLAEKHDVVEITLPKGMTSRRFLDLVLEVEAHDESEDQWERENIAFGKTHGWPKTRIAQMERDLRKAQAARARFWKKIPAHAHDAVKSAAEACSDKWGPAVAVELRNAEARDAKKHLHAKRGSRVWLVFGYCSS